MDWNDRRFVAWRRKIEQAVAAAGGGAGAVEWGSISGLPATFPPDPHDHAGVYSPVGHDHAGVYAPAAHTHAYLGFDQVARPLKPAVGGFFDQSLIGHNGATIAGAAGRCELSPWFCPWDVTIDQIGVAVSTLVASAQAKVVVYAAGSDGWPADLIYESAALDCGSTGFKQVAASLVFAKGTRLWVGARHSSTATLRGIPITCMPPLGFHTGSNDGGQRSIIRRTVTFANAAPSPWVFSAAELVANTVPVSVRMRVAA